MFNPCLKQRTERVRRNIVYGVAKIVTPRLYVEIRENHEFIQRTPRPFTLHLRQVFGDKPLVGVEIGFGLGQNAESLLENLNIRWLYCVDPCIGRPYDDLGGVVSAHVGRYNRVDKLRLDKRVEFVELPSDMAVSVLPVGVDFVYVDGLHTFEQCFRDLKNYVGLVREGGFLGGHDFTRACEVGVVRAVLEFSGLVGLVPVVVMPDFWFEVKDGTN